MLDVCEGQELVLHSSNGLDYRILVENINDCRPPEMIYAIDVIDPNGNSYYMTSGDWYFCGQEFIDKCTVPDECLVGGKA